MNRSMQLSIVPDAAAIAASSPPSSAAMKPAAAGGQTRPAMLHSADTQKTADAQRRAA